MGGGILFYATRIFWLDSRRLTFKNKELATETTQRQAPVHIGKHLVKLYAFTTEFEIHPHQKYYIFK
jgi:hypothetical protein